MGLHFLALSRGFVRFQLVRAGNAESVALYRGAARELAAARAKLAAAARTLLRKIEWGRTSRSSPTRTSSPHSRCRSHHRAQVLRGEVEFGVVTQARVRVSNRAGGAQHRRRALRAALGACRGDGAPGTTLGDARHHRRCRERERQRRAGRNRAEEIGRLRDGDQHHPRVSYDAACLATARRSAWNASPCAHTSLAASCGATSPSNCASRPWPSWSEHGQMRQIRSPGAFVAGVWSKGTGEIIAPARDDALIFLPQAPYPSKSPRAGSLPGRRRRIGKADADPSSATASSSASSSSRRRFDDDDILAALDACGLGDLVGRFADRGGLDAREEWSDVLSSEEQQRVAFARLYLRRPCCAFLDERPSALDETSEAAMYEMARRRARIVQRGTPRDAAQAPHAGVAIRRGGWGRRGDVGGEIRRGSRGRAVAGGCDGGGGRLDVRVTLGLLRSRQSSSSARRCRVGKSLTQTPRLSLTTPPARVWSRGKRSPGEWITSSNFNRGRPPTKKEVAFAVVALRNPRHRRTSPRSGGVASQKP